MYKFGIATSPWVYPNIFELCKEISRITWRSKTDFIVKYTAISVQIDKNTVLDALIYRKATLNMCELEFATTSLWKSLPLIRSLYFRFVWRFKVELVLEDKLLQLR